MVQRTKHWVSQPRYTLRQGDGSNMIVIFFRISSRFRGSSFTAPFATFWKGMVMSRRHWSVFDKCRMNCQGTLVPTMGDPSGNLVRDSNHDVAGANSRNSLRFSRTLC